jgi:hypothetical protein
VPAGALLDLHDPDVGVEPDLAGQRGLDIRLRLRLRLAGMDEGPVRRARSAGRASSKALCGAGA